DRRKSNNEREAPTPIRALCASLCDTNLVPYSALASPLRHEVQGPSRFSILLRGTIGDWRIGGLALLLAAVHFAPFIGLATTGVARRVNPNEHMGSTFALEAEVALLFIVSGAIDVLYHSTLSRGRSALAKLVLFFLTAGALRFGSGLVIVPFLQQGLVTEYAWLNEREFLIAVGVGRLRAPW